MMHALFHQVLAQCCCGAAAPPPPPPSPTYLLIDFENATDDVSINGLSIPGASFSGAGYGGSENNFSPLPADVGYSGDLFAVSDENSITLNITNPSASRFQRLRFRYFGALAISITGTQGSITPLLIDLGAQRRWYLYDWANVMSGEEYISSIVFMRGTTSMGPMGIDHIELASNP